MKKQQSTEALAVTNAPVDAMRGLQGLKPRRADRVNVAVKTATHKGLAAAGGEWFVLVATTKFAPQRLKPRSSCDRYGTAEAVP